jgi:DNA-binding NtrC family response regulator
MEKVKNVLILDDEPIVGERLKPALEKAGFTVEAFTESQKALDRLEEKKFHVVITDIRMSGPDGIDVLSFVKKHKLNTEVIVITGYGSIETVLDSKYLGAFGYVRKPFKMDELCKLVVRAAEKVC